MSEKSKGDTSAQIKNNPLLSASITGMLLDDFPNKPFLLPAAPIVVKQPEMQKINTIELLQQSSVRTIEPESDTDLDNFSEVNLNLTADDPVPLQSDLNDNSFPQIQHEPLAHNPSEFADESILSQAASSFSQLPSVASTVFSTFSKVINNYTPNPNRETNSAEPDVNQNLGIPAFPSNNYIDQQNIPTKSITTQLPPPLTAGTTVGNTYRLAAKKKTYAQIPGLSSSSTAKQIDQNYLQNNFVFSPQSQTAVYSPPANELDDKNNFNFSTTQSFVGIQGTENIINQPVAITTVQQTETKLEEKNRSSPFSLSNFVPPVLQNLTGFVKSTVVGNSESTVSQQLQQPYPPQQDYVNVQSNDFAVQLNSNQNQFPSFVNTADTNSSTQFLNYSSNTNTSIPPNVGGNQIGFESFSNPAAGPPLKPPAASSGTSFRLQKGTRLYKSPFQTAPIPSAPSIQEAFTVPSNEKQQVPIFGNSFLPNVTEHNSQPVINQSSVLAPSFPTQPVNLHSAQIFSPSNSGLHTERPELNTYSAAYEQSSFQTSTNPLKENIPTIQPELSVNDTTDSSYFEEKRTELPLPPAEVLESSHQLRSLGSAPNFPPPPAEESPSKQDQYDSVPLQPPSIEQEPVEPFLQNQNSTKTEESNIIFFNSTSLSTDLQQSSPFNSPQSLDKNSHSEPPLRTNLWSGPEPPPSLDKNSLNTTVQQTNLSSGPTPPPVSFSAGQQATNPFRRGSSSSKSSKTGANYITTQPIFYPSQLPQTPQNSQEPFLEEIPSVDPTASSSQNFFQQQISQTNTNEAFLAPSNPILFPSQLPQTPKSSTESFFQQSSDSTINTAEKIPQKQKEQTVESNSIFLQTTIGNISSPNKLEAFEKSQKEHNIITQPQQNINLFSYFGNKVDNVLETNQSENINSNDILLHGNTLSADPETLPKRLNDIQISDKKELTAPTTSEVVNFFQPQNQVQNNLSTLRQKEVDASAYERKENFNISEKSTPEKFENNQSNILTNFFASNQQHQNQNSNQTVRAINPTQFEIQRSTTSIASSQSSFPEIPQAASDPVTFFDSFVNTENKIINQFDDNTNCASVENPNSQRIQNFFNYPPPQNLGELNYNFYPSTEQKSSLEKKDNLTANLNETNRSTTPTSNLVEPPSSACSEFSSDYFNNSAVDRSVNLDNSKNLTVNDIPEELLEKFNMTNLLNPSNVVYHPAPKHWFYKAMVDCKPIWKPFSFKDSEALEESLQSQGRNIVPVEGGRYDVNISEKSRTPVYWTGDQSEVRRCSWFYKSLDSKYIPYEESICDLLEEEYRNASNSGEWNQKITLPTGDLVVFHGPALIVHFLQSQTLDAWGGAPQTQSRPRTVKRDLEDFGIENGETDKVDHLLFMVHGIGSGCDLKFRSVEEVVDDFRSISYQLVQSHYKNAYSEGEIGRVEVLPISWHDELHSKESGIDEKLKAITLESIPKLRNFANDTVLDVLFYTSPQYCQSIINIVANSMNRVYLKYCERHIDFNGTVSLAGHSLGSIILFDLLCHQKPVEDNDTHQMQNQIVNAGCGVGCSVAPKIHYAMNGSGGIGQPFIDYPQLLFAPKKLFALGSPIGMFLTIRGIESLGLDFKLPTCNGFYNIFHPYDPVAYRIEALVNPELSVVRPVLIPHHKGRKRMHLELKETMTRVGTEVKQKILDTFKNTMESVFFLASKNKNDRQEIEKEVDKVLEYQLKMDQQPSRIRTDSTSSVTNSDPEIADVDLPLGRLNNSSRIDYVLQEAPLEFFNEYLFALTSHVCYWESEDTILFVVKEIYSFLGISTDSQIPQQSMKVERPSRSSYSISSNS